MGQKLGGSEKMKRSRVREGSKGSVTSENWGGGVLPMMAYTGGGSARMRLQVFRYMEG